MTVHLAATAIDVLNSQHPPQVMLRRAGAGSYVNGRWVDGSPEPERLVRGTMYQMSGDEQNNMSEELRRDDMRVFWTREDLRIRNGDSPEDKLIYNGNEYDVIKVNERFEGLYHRVVIGRNHVRTNTI